MYAFDSTCPCICGRLNSMNAMVAFPYCATIALNFPSALQSLFSEQTKISKSCLGFVSRMDAMVAPAC